MKKQESSKFVKVTAKVTSKITPVLQVIIAIGALIVLLGLAVKGAGQYLDNVSEEQKVVAAVVVVVLLTYSVATGLKKIIK